MVHIVANAEWIWTKVAILPLILVSNGLGYIKINFINCINSIMLLLQNKAGHKYLHIFN